LKQKLFAIPDLRLVVIDPLSSFTAADIDGDNQAGAAIMGALGALANDTGATVIGVHHTSKGNPKQPIRTLEQARAAIRGVSSLVDNSRFAYSLWAAGEDTSVKVTKTLGLPFNPREDMKMVVIGGLVKANEKSDESERYFVRDRQTGLLIDRTAEFLRAKPKATSDAMDALVAAVGAAANAGHWLPKKDDWCDHSEQLQSTVEYETHLKKLNLGRDELRHLVKKAIANRLIFETYINGGKEKGKIHLTVKDGPFYQDRRGRG
jgi:hypothetical protein